MVFSKEEIKSLDPSFRWDDRGMKKKVGVNKLIFTCHPSESWDPGF